MAAAEFTAAAYRSRQILILVSGIMLVSISAANMPEGERIATRGW